MEVVFVISINAAARGEGTEAGVRKTEEEEPVKETEGSRQGCRGELELRE